jgi:hypothetical protein
MVLVAFLLFALVGVSVAQDFSIPGGWRVSTSYLRLVYFPGMSDDHLQEIGQNRTLAQRTTLAATGINQVTSLINSNDAEYDAIVRHVKPSAGVLADTTTGILAHCLDSLVSDGQLRPLHEVDKVQD